MLWPYCSGVVEEVNVADPGQFKVGDEVIGTWAAFGVGGMAEYAIVSTKLAMLKPVGVSAVEGAALVNSSVHAMLMLDRAQLKGDERVLVIGGSGGVGSTLVQLAKSAGASFVAAVSTDEPMLKTLGVDRVVNYKEENFWEVPDFARQPFDVIFDCAVGVAAWKKARNVLKPRGDGGRFIAGVFNEWTMHCERLWQLPGILLPPFSRQLRSSFGKSPRYEVHLGEINAKGIERMCKLVEENKFKVAIDPASPFPFTVHGVADAFNLLRGRGGHGKIVVAM